MVRPSEARTEVIVRTPPLAPRRRHVARRFGQLAVVVVVPLLVAQGVSWFSARRPADRVVDVPIAVATAAVVRTDMTNSESLPGTLGYGAARPAKGGAGGIVTWLPSPGMSVERGEQLYRADDRPVLLFYGGMPLYRALDETGTVGKDVRIVAANLKALGYPIGRQPGPGQKVTRTTRPSAVATSPPDNSGKPPDGDATDTAGKPPNPEADATDTAGKPPGTEDGRGRGKAPAPDATPTGSTTRVTVRKGEGVLTTSLIAALKSWQRDVGLPVTGRIGIGDVVVSPGAVRVDSVAVHLGDNATGTLMSVTSTAKVVTVSADFSQAGAIEQDDRVSIVLPDDDKVPGKVVAVGTTVQSGAGDPDAPPKLIVTVAVDDPRTVARLDAADVQVHFVAETHEDVLAVPVGALVALAEGGYAVQIADGGLVAVRTGMFARGLVEVTGDGLDEGMKVVTAG